MCIRRTIRSDLMIDIIIVHCMSAMDLSCFSLRIVVVVFFGMLEFAVCPPRVSISMCSVRDVRIYVRIVVSHRIHITPSIISRLRRVRTTGSLRCVSNAMVILPPRSILTLV